MQFQVSKDTLARMGQVDDVASTIPPLHQAESLAKEVEDTWYAILSSVKSGDETSPQHSQLLGLLDKLEGLESKMNHLVKSVREHDQLYQDWIALQQQKIDERIFDRVQAIADARDSLESGMIIAKEKLDSISIARAEPLNSNEILEYASRISNFTSPPNPPTLRPAYPPIPQEQTMGQSILFVLSAGEGTAGGLTGQGDVDGLATSAAAFMELDQILFQSSIDTTTSEGLMTVKNAELIVVSGDDENLNKNASVGKKSAKANQISPAETEDLLDLDF